MIYRITPPERLHVSIGLPPSKSVSNRALVLHALSGGKTEPRGLSDCDDTRVMRNAFDKPGDTIDIAGAGTAMRFLTAYLSVTPGAHTLTGTARMQQRPIGVLVDALRSIGAQIDYEKEEGFPPLRITGAQLNGGSVMLPGNVSSQYTSALLMAGAVMPQGLHLRLTGDIISRPYIDLTLKLMADYGAKARWTSPTEIVVEPSGYQPTDYEVEADWSAASYWYEITALMNARQHLASQNAPKPNKNAPKPADNEDEEECSLPEVTLLGLDDDSGQGDRRGAELFARIGILTAYDAQGVHLAPMGLPVARMVDDFTDMPDLAQTFVVSCCMMGIPFRFSGLQSLRIKETDRMAALIGELHKLGYVVRDEGPGLLCWHGERCPAEADPLIHTYDDHRMAMAFAPASIMTGPLRIDHPEVVTKSYPGYWDDLKKAGFSISEE